ncbi:4Fe-4S dicluster domain-containing protein [Bradyrhizobium sp.]|uniref:4Fe-4S dicluster domain-containing protein n=1 Tax=Bradyrhizobium sp. TaxID=376 RepID=UPI003C43EFD8
MKAHDEFPDGSAGARPSRDAGLNRRSALKFFLGGVATTLASCGRPPEEVVPYVQIPERETPGLPLQFASALPLAGYGRGVIVTSVEGRPIKINGNPRHPASLGSTDVFGEATILSLYDPDRSKAPYGGNRIQSWSSFEAALLPRLDQLRAKQGAGLALLTGRITSPTLIAQIDALMRSMPNSKWYRYEPVEDDAIRAGAMQAFGQAATGLPRLRDARVVLTLDADPIGFGPQQIRSGRDLVEARRSHVPTDSLRLYTAEPSWTLTGALADHRVALQPELIRNVAIEIARALGAAAEPPQLPGEAEQFTRAAAADLMARRGAALVLAGPRQLAEVHALCHWINAQLQAPVDFIAPVDPVATGHADSLRGLVADIHAGRVGTLIMMGVNPVYDTPGELGFADALSAVPFSVQLGPYRDETAERCTWHLPQTHVLESWSDIRAFDGTASIVQPLIQPLYDSRNAHQMLAMLQGDMASSPIDLVRRQWQPQSGANGDPEAWWRQALQDGVVANTASARISLPAPKLPQLAPAASAQNYTLVLSPDPSVFDGSMANNAWLQECPKPFTRQVWGNALHLAEEDAKSLGLVDGDVIQLKRGQTSLEAAVLVRAGQAPQTIEATLGYGRTRAGSLGNGVGFDVYPARQMDSPWLTDGFTIVRTGRNENLLRTQHFFELEGEARDLQPRLTLSDLAKDAAKHDFDFSKPGANPPTLYPAPHDDTYEWAMAIDASACIGCNACVVACQAENNVPIVGPDEIAEGRDMHWLRIDDYVVDGRPGFSPTPCMHCEHAPCEPVCPVAASVHDSEGLNLQVYNRCVGTRFCESNCPYKVRRFNFFGYADGEEYGSLGEDIVKAVFNPNVTVRARGVMEKCTYCVQRISLARRDSEKEGRAIGEGEVVTACQAACPTQAINFGNLSNQKAAIHALRSEARSYALLGELGTRPRTTYLARLQNPNPDYGKARS